MSCKTSKQLWAVYCVILVSFSIVVGGINQTKPGFTEYIVRLQEDTVRDKLAMKSLLDEMTQSLGAEIIRQHRFDDNGRGLIVAVSQDRLVRLRELQGVESVVEKAGKEEDQTDGKTDAGVESTTEETNGEAGYIVVLKKKIGAPYDVSADSQDQVMARMANDYGIVTRKRYRTLQAFWVMGNASTIDQAKLAMADDVEFIESNRKLQLPAADTTCHEQSTGETYWGLTRIGMREWSSYEGNRFPFSNMDNGTEVTAYVMDSGINIDHVDFGKRARWGYTVSETGEGDFDGNGHGTHVAGTIGGRFYGVAKGVDLVAVKVLTSQGSGYTSWLLDGLEWVINDFNSNGNGKAVINLSLGGPASLASDNAIQNAIDQGIVVVVAAGNEGVDACTRSPARMSEVITTASCGRFDIFSYFSNHGRCVDVIAPGEDIVSASHTGTTSTATMQGTSMAAPHVAGVVARYLSTQCNAPSPGAVKTWLLSQTTADEILAAPSLTPNKLLFTECLTTGTCSDECKSIWVRGSNYQNAKHGDYEIVSERCGGRSAYRHQTGLYFIYYQHSASIWVVGPSVCGSSGYLQAWGPSARTPDETGSVWKEYTGTFWMTNSRIRATCVRVCKHGKWKTSRATNQTALKGTLLGLIISIAMLALMMTTTIMSVLPTKLRMPDIAEQEEGEASDSAPSMEGVWFTVTAVLLATTQIAHGNQ